MTPFDVIFSCAQKIKKLNVTKKAYKCTYQTKLIGQCTEHSENPKERMSNQVNLNEQPFRPTRITSTVVSFVQFND